MLLFFSAELRIHKMFKNLTYKHTTYACYMAYIVGAVINNFVPLLFVVFQNQFSLSLDKLAVLIALNFIVQIFVDLFGAKYVDKIGYRLTLVLALAFAAAGLCFLGTLPVLMPPFVGLIISVIFYAIGSGLLEVMVSPTIEALPNDAKASAMSLLHSFYCWGSMLVVIVSTIYFRKFSVENWRWLCYAWAILPVITLLIFTKVPIVPFGEGESETSAKKLFSSGLFRIFALLMLCAGAAELAMSQWASLFAETGLGVSKTTGDLLGPCLFAATMGIGRAVYGKYGEKLNLYSALIISAVICIAGYLTAVFAPNPIVSLLGCGLVGLGSAIMWPGTLSLAAAHCAFGGTAIFGFLAMAGDIGCSTGPSLVAAVSERIQIFGSSLKAGLLFAIIFPAILLFEVIRLKKRLKNKNEK